MLVLFLLLGIALEALLGHPRNFMRIRYLFAHLYRMWQSLWMRRGPGSAALRDGLGLLVFLLVGAGLPGLLCLLVPFLGVVCYYMALDARTLCDRAMVVRRALDDGELSSARAVLTQFGSDDTPEDYEAIVRDTVSGLLSAFSRYVLGMVLFLWIGLPFGLGPAMALAYALLAQLAQAGNRYARPLHRFLARLMLPVTSLGIALFCGIIGLSTRRAFGALGGAWTRPGDVMLAALGIKGTHRRRSVLVSGDITQACVMCWVLLAVLVGVGILILALLGML